MLVRRVLDSRARWPSQGWGSSQSTRRSRARCLEAQTQFGTIVVVIVRYRFRGPGTMLSRDFEGKVVTYNSPQLA